MTARLLWDLLCEMVGIPDLGHTPDSDECFGESMEAWMPLVLTWDHTVRSG